MTISETGTQESPSRIKSISQWIWAITLVAALVVLVISGWRAFRVHTSASWPTVQGNIRFSDIQFSPVSRTINKYRLNLAYRYRVKGIQYESNRISFVQKTSYIGRLSGERYVKQAIDRYPAGARVTIHYQPMNPGVAVLETHFPKGLTKMLVLGLAMSLLALTGLWRRWTMQTDHLFQPYDPDAPMTASKFILGAMGLGVIIGIIWLWWELIKLYAGR